MEGRPQRSLQWALCAMIAAGAMALSGTAVAQNPEQPAPVDCPVDVVICVDVSASAMRDAPARRREIGRAVDKLTRMLGPRVRVGLATFGVGGRTLARPAALADGHREALLKALEELRFNEPWTDLHAGLDTAWNLAMLGAPARKGVIILLTDARISLKAGKAAEAESEAVIRGTLLPQIRKSGVRVYGAGFKDGPYELVNKVGTESGGLYRRALEPADFSRILESWAWGLCPQPDPDEEEEGAAEEDEEDEDDDEDDDEEEEDDDDDTVAAAASGAAGGGLAWWHALLIVLGAGALAGGVATAVMVSRQSGGGAGVRSPPPGPGSGPPSPPRAPDRGVSSPPLAPGGLGTQQMPLDGEAPPAPSSEYGDLGATVLPGDLRPLSAAPSGGPARDRSGGQTVRVDNADLAAPARRAPAAAEPDAPATVPTPLPAPSGSEHHVFVVLKDRYGQLIRTVEFRGTEDRLWLYGPDSRAAFQVDDLSHCGRLHFQMLPTGPVVTVDDVPPGGFRDYASGRAVDVGLELRNNVTLEWPRDQDGRRFEVVFK